MSRDFELLQRLEREWGRSPSFPDNRYHIAPAEIQRGVLKIDKELPSSVSHPAANLVDNVRGELTKLIVSIFLGNPSSKVVMFTGVEAGEYSKCAAACIADLLAENSRARVCLMDADQAIPTMHRAYSLPNKRGLADLLAGACSIEDATIRAGENLWVIPAGAQNSGRQTAPAAFHQAISDVMEQCDYVVIAAPDYGRYAEISAMGPAVEGAVLVLDAVKTRRVAAQDAKAALELAKIPVLGSILNNRAYSTPQLPRLRE